ncbi:MAG: translation initiation factor IF-3 [Anaerolineae bacterium]|nr:translation initiation factor IF-3 [Anaerolineae bacterium]
MSTTTTQVNANQFIRAPKVRLIDQNGENLGIVPTDRALQIAREANLDLVEIAASADPPVCKVLDLGKYLFEQTKKERQARKSQTKIEVKEIRLRPKTNEHHRGFKVRDARRWLEDGMKVKVTIRFRGREVTYPEIALEDLREIAEDLRDVSVIEVAPSMEGRSMTLVLAPSKGAGKKADKPAEKPAADAKPAAESKEAKETKEATEPKEAKAESAESKSKA